MNAILKNALALAGVAFATQAAAEVTFYEHEGYKGRSFSTEQQIENFKRVGFNDRASSIVVDRDWWQVCEDVQFGGRCVVLRPGRYPSLAAMGLNDSVSSVRVMTGNGMNASARYAGNPYLSAPVAVEDLHRHEDARRNGNPYLENSYLPAPVAAYDFHRRYNERTYEANVTSVRAVVGPPEQRCWVENEEVVQDKHRSNAPGAIVGALLGGILGHQIGDGSGKDLATAGGAIAGAVMGANVGRDHGAQQVSSHEVQHCANTARYARTEYWDVTYTFHGREHRIQTTDHPGSTVTVTEQGEPRV